MIPSFDKRPHWLKGRGYLHVTPKIDVFSKYQEIYAKVTDENFVARHGFFPLIHSVIKERKYKKLPDNPKIRAHSYWKNNTKQSSAKLRPLHYSTHIDAMIFSYYAELLLNEYEKELEKVEGLSDCVIAYRKIDLESKEYKEDDGETEGVKGKSTIHFAKEAFDEIAKRAQSGCIVLMFDIESFFSNLNHDLLKSAWCNLLKVSRLNKAHYNVFKAATDFRYILRDDLRLESKGDKRSGFDEAKLAEIRSKYGTDAFFGSVEELRHAIESKNITVFKHPFVKKTKKEVGGGTSITKSIVGIPQGLPISAVLANLYLLAFDNKILENVVGKMGGFYRRYSDDILIICDKSQVEDVKVLVQREIMKTELSINTKKTEIYLFEKRQISPSKNRIVSILLDGENEIIGKPVTYLGFEFYGTKSLIKSANLAKFYRRMILLTKRKAHRARKLSENNEGPKAVFQRQLKKRYSIRKLSKEKEFIRRKKTVKRSDGSFSYKMVPIERKHNSNYFSYVKRASRIMNEPAILHQLRKHKHIFHSAIREHLKG